MCKSANVKDDYPDLSHNLNNFKVRARVTIEF